MRDRRRLYIVIMLIMLTQINFIITDTNTYKGATQGHKIPLKNWNGSSENMISQYYINYITTPL